MNAASTLLLAFAFNAGVQDTVVVRATRPGWQNVRLVEELRIGALEGADAYTFGRIRRIAAGKDGSMFVGDEHGPRLLMYDSTGRFRKQVGRAGSGPNQYRTVRDLVTIPDGRLVYYDVETKRVTLFSAQGVPQSSFPFRSSFFGWFRSDSAGHLLMLGSRIARGAPEPGAERPVEGPRLESVVVRVSTTGTVLDTIERPRLTTRSQVPGFALMAGEGDAETSQGATSVQFGRSTDHLARAAYLRCVPAGWSFSRHGGVTAQNTAIPDARQSVVGHHAR
ncbi:MAG: 6-bladed beta-propeller [Gemmatimonadota bacterium]